MSYRQSTKTEDGFGRCVSQPALPVAIRSLNDEELRTLLVALLYEWRNRTTEAESRPV
jgi:hypothetical protein